MCGRPFRAIIAAELDGLRNVARQMSGNHYPPRCTCNVLPPDFSGGLTNGQLLVGLRRLRARRPFPGWPAFCSRPCGPRGRDQHCRPEGIGRASVSCQGRCVTGISRADTASDIAIESMPSLFRSQAPQGRSCPAGRLHLFFLHLQVNVRELVSNPTSERRLIAVMKLRSIEFCAVSLLDIGHYEVGLNQFRDGVV